MKPNFQQQLQMLSPALQTQYYKEQKEEWDKLIVNIDIPLNYRRFALAFEKPTSLDVHAEYFNWFGNVAEIPEVNMSDAITFCRACERSFIEFIMLFGNKPESANEYGRYLVFCEELTTTVNETIEPIKDKLMRKMQTLQTLQNKNGNRTIELPS